MICPHCGREHPDKAKFCPVTGKTILQDKTDDGQTFLCPDCGNPFPIGAKFCPVCGADPPPGMPAANPQQKTQPSAHRRVASNPASEETISLSKNRGRTKPPVVIPQSNSGLATDQGDVSPLFNELKKTVDLPEIPDVPEENQINYGVKVQESNAKNNQSSPLGAETRPLRQVESPQPANPESLEGWMDDNQLQKTLAVVRSRKREEGYARTLIELLEKEPSNAAAWFWLSSELKTDSERHACLQKALSINPQHPAAILAWDKIGVPGATPQNEPIPIVEKPAQSEIQAEVVKPLPVEFDQEKEMTPPHPVVPPPAASIRRDQKSIPPRRTAGFSSIPSNIPESEDLNIPAFPPPSAPAAVTYPQKQNVISKVTGGKLLPIISLAVAIILLISQIFMTFRMTALEDDLYLTRESLKSFEKLVVELGVRVEMLEKR